METILSLDRSLFWLINTVLANPLFDLLMPFITNFDNFKILVILIWFSLIIFGKRKGRVTAGLLVLVLVICDQLNSHLLKEMFGRIRPCRGLEGVRLLVSCGSGPSFPSSHAANIFAAAALLSYKYRRFAIPFFIYAILIAYSRVYVGVHYPSDVIAGAFVGLIVAASVLYIEKSYGEKIMKNYKFWIGILISAIFVYWTFKGVDLKKFLGILAGINYLYLPLLLLLLFVAFYVRALRWRYLLGKEIKIKTHSLFSYIMIGFMANNILPARIGEFVRAYIIGKKENISKSFAFSTIVVERIFDGIVILLLFIPTIFFYPLPQWLKKTGLVVGLFYPLVLVFLIILKVHKEWVLRLVDLILKPISPALLLKVKGILSSFIEGLGVLYKVDHLLVIIFYSFIVWTATPLMFYVGFLCFNIPLHFYACFFVFGMVFLGVMIPASPGFIGTFHWFCLQAFLLLGLKDENLAASYAFFMHMINYLPVTSVGLLYLIKENISLSELEKSSNEA